MSNRVVYEVSLRISDDQSVALGAWLPEHIDSMLALPGFIEAQYFDPHREDDGGWTHTVQYILSNRDALDAYLENDAPRMRQDGIDRFGDAMSSSRSIREVVSTSAPDTQCLNCGATLRGQYCWNCGQRGNTRLISLGELIRDAFGDMFELDSRLWRTLIPLVTKPGHLTAEYLRGRRARFMPPFRMYLVLSFLFFLLSQVLGDGPGVTIDDGTTQGFEDGFNDAREASLAEDLEALDVPADVAAEVAARTAETIQSVEAAQAQAEDTVVPAATEAEAAANAELAESEDTPCDFEEPQQTGIPWIDNQFPLDRQQRICEDVTRDQGKRLVERWIDNAPVAALAVLPLMALLLKAMYPLSRRYYVEHLLMLVHFHSFLFLLWSLGLSFNAVTLAIGLPEAIVIIVNVLGWLFVPVYLYQSIRAVYAQGRAASLAKFVVMLSGYLVATILVILITFLFIIATY
ncbi:MAG: DUF4286 family protein [Pseudomonadota bacterium]